MNKIDQIMEQASEKLAEMAYPVCERLCLQALELARAAEDYDRYARILLPLQEARRQRRQMAVEAGVSVLGEPRQEHEAIVEQHPQGCLLLLSPPYHEDDETAIRRLAIAKGLLIEVLLMDSQSLRQCFEQQMERIGDAALAAIDRTQPPPQRVDALAEVLQRIGDHEIAHQRLADAARKAAREPDADAAP